MFKKALIFILFYTLITGTYANPNGGQVIKGNATITRSQSQVIIQQKSQKAIINWKKFNIGANQTTSFIQPKGGVILNRVVGQPFAASRIFGTLNATGKIILINPAGIYFGKTARVNVGSIIASTSDISNRNFMEGNYVFDQPSALHGSVINEGKIIAADFGLVALVGAGVLNDGTIQANLGSVVLASGDKFTFDLYGDQLVNFTVDAPITESPKDQEGNPLKSAVNNSGVIIADGGKIIMTASAARDVVDNVINMSGVAQAQSVKEVDGEIILAGNDEGTVDVSGILDASGINPNELGGNINIFGKDILIDATAVMDVRGERGGGQVLVGGNLKGQGPQPHAKNVYVNEGATFLADALMQGNGGKIIIWSDNNTSFHGKVSAQGGALSGDGGFLETSGSNLSIVKSQVDLLALQGNTGVWLLDPADLTISNEPSTPAFTNPYVALTNSNVNVTDLETALAGANVILETGVSGTGGNGDITVVDNVSWASGNSLTLSAYRHIILDANLNSSGAATVNLQSDNTGTGTGTVSGAGVVTTNGALNIYYNPSSFSSPTNYSANMSGSGTLTAYMLVNSLGNAADTPAAKTLGSLFNSANAAIWSNNYALGRDIDASATSSWNSGLGFTPIGKLSTPFSGSFDGQNHVVDQLYLNRNVSVSGDFGFFGNTGSTAIIQNLGVTNVNMILHTDGQLGGLVGQNVGLIQNSYSTGTLTASGSFLSIRIGGLVGQNSDNTGGTIVDSYSTANIVDTSGQGGFRVLGGLVGFNRPNGVIQDSFATGQVSSNLVVNGLSLMYMGGLIGEHAGTSITNSYSLGNVTLTGAGTTPDTRIGGFIGSLNVGSVSNNYSVGRVSATHGSIGGFSGTTAGSPTNNYWNTETSGQASSAAGSGLTTAQLQSALPSGFSSSTWDVISGVSYPYLKALFPETPRIISGLVLDGSTPLVNQAVYMKLVGSAADLTQSNTASGDNGYYYFMQPNGVVANGSTVMTYLLPANIFSDPVANTFAIAPNAGGHLTDITLTRNVITLLGASSSNSTLAQAALDVPEIALLYSASGNDITLGNSYNWTSDLNTQSGLSYTADGNIDSTFSSNITFGGPVTITGGGTIKTLGSQEYMDILTITAPTATLDASDPFTSNFIHLDGNVIAPDTMLTLKNSSDIQYQTMTLDQLILQGVNTTLGADFSSSNGLQFLNGSSVTITAPLTYTGNTLIDNTSNVLLSVNDGLPVTTILTNNGYLGMNDIAQEVAGLEGSGVIENIGANRNFTVNNTGSHTYSGQFIGNILLNKSGSGTLILDNANVNIQPYPAMFILGGKVEVQNTNALPASDIFVNAGTTFAINMPGSIFTTYVTLNGTFINEAGNVSFPNVFSLGSTATLQSNGTMTLEAMNNILASNTNLNLTGTGSIRFDTNTIIGSFNSINTDSTLTTIFNNGGFTTTQNQTYQGPVSLLSNTLLTTDTGTISLNGVTGNGFDLALQGTSGNNRFNLSGLNDMGGGAFTIQAIINSPISAPYQNNTIDFSGYNSTLDLILDDASNINNGILRVKADGSTLVQFTGIATAVGNNDSHLTVAKGNPTILYDSATRSGMVVDPFYFFNISADVPAPPPPAPIASPAILPNSVLYVPTTLIYTTNQDAAPTIFNNLVQLENNVIQQQMQLDEFYNDILTVCTG